MAYDAKAVANFFLDRAEEDGKQLTPMKLQKLIYFAHGWYLGIYHEPLITDPIEAWKFGPVIPSIYHEFKIAGSGAISSRATEIDWNDMEYVVSELPEDDGRTRALLNKVWSIYGGKSAVTLSNLTHLDGTPWEEARRDNADGRNVLIDDALIEKYFGDKASENRKKAETAAEAKE